MNIEMLKKAGPIIGLIVSLSTTSFAGYKIFAAPLEHKSQVPSLPDPTPTSESEQEEIVETIFVDEPVLASGTPTPKATPAVSAAGGGKATSKSTGATGARGTAEEDREDEEDHEDGHDEDHEVDKDDGFNDDSDDTLTITQHDREDDHETPTPTQKPENR